MLLDEATAFADPENEHLIQQALQELSKNKTTLMIAHRLTSVQNVDKNYYQQTAFTNKCGKNIKNPLRGRLRNVGANPRVCPNQII